VKVTIVGSGVATQRSDMSFGVACETTGLEWASPTHTPGNERHACVIAGIYWRAWCLRRKGAATFPHPEEARPPLLETTP
jgi:hypothetical protein